jgi:hypothetical protein
MANRRIDLATGLAMAVAVLSLSPSIAAQTPQTVGGATHAVPAERTWTPPRTLDGQPDIRGVWNRRVPDMAGYALEGGPNDEHLLLSAGCAQGIVGCERSTDEIEAEIARRRGQSGTIIVDPPDGKVPYQPWAAAKRQEIAANHTNPRGPADIDPQSRCFLGGVPRVTYQEVTGIQIHQVMGKVILTYEFNHAYRIIPLDGSPHVGGGITLWMGDSRGRWDGNTLVVDVTNFTDRTWFDVVGTFHSDALHVVERYTFVDTATIHYEATITDPKVFTRPWTIAFPLIRNTQRGFERLEMACHEGERSFGLMLRP